MSFLFLLVNEMRAETWRFETGSDFRLKSQAVPAAISNYATGWTDDMRLTSGAHAQIPFITNDADGIHLVWTGGSTDSNPFRFQSKYMRSQDRGRTWDIFKILSENTTGFANPTDIISDSKGLHVVWSDGRDFQDNYGHRNEEIYYRQSIDGGATWGAEKRLTNSDGRSFYPKLASDSDGLHIVWTDNRNGNYEVYYATSTDGGLNWGIPRRLTSGCVTTWPEQANIISDATGLHVFWPDERDGNSGCEIYYKKSIDGGITWTADKRLTFTPNQSDGPRVCSNSDGLHLAWTEYQDDPFGEVYYMRSTDGGDNWKMPIRITDTVGYNSYIQDFVSDSYGFYLFWMDYSTGKGDIYCSTSTDGGGSWSGAQRLTFDPEYQIGARATSVDGVLHMTFADERNVPTDGFSSLYYKRYDPTDPTGKPTMPIVDYISDGGRTINWAWTKGTVDDPDSNFVMYSAQWWKDPGGIEDIPDEGGNGLTGSDLTLGVEYRIRTRARTENYRYSEYSEWSGAVSVNTAFDKTYVYPNPFRNKLGYSNITFTNLTNDSAKIKIYTLTGEMVKTIYKDALNTEAVWDLTNNNRREVASGVYFYYIKNDYGNKKGKIAVIR